MLSWLRRFRLPHPPLVLFRVRRPPLFYFLPISGFARSGPGVLVLVFALSLFFCLPLLVSRLSNLSSQFHSHLIFIPFSSSPSHHLQGHPCVCVERLNRHKTSLAAHYMIFFPEGACEGFFVKKQPSYYIFTP